MIIKAKAAVFMGAHKDFEVREFDVTETPKGYGQMALIASGICGTDLHFHNGKLAINPPTVIGHEFVGKSPIWMRRMQSNMILPLAIT